MSEPHTVTEPLPIAFIVMEGRALYDPSAALIFEVIKEANYERTWKQFQKDYVYRHIDAVLTIWHEYKKGVLKFRTCVHSMEDITKFVQEFQTNE
jgi:hypothetical protein